MQGSPPLHHSPTLSSSSSSTSSLSRHSLSPSLSPAHSIKSSKKGSHQRRPSPLKRQMSLGTTTAASDNGAPFDINPLRTHTAGPLAVLYSVEPEEDPLLAVSVSRSPSKLSTNSLHSSPFNEVLDPPVPVHPGTPRSVSALAALDRASGAPPAYPPASPNRSLLSAFQAVSPRLQNVTSRSSSAPSLSNLNNGSRTTSPRGPVPQLATLGPASPISTSPRQSTHQRTSYATAAFRALNGATSPQKQVPSRTSSSSSAAWTSNAASLNVSPVRSRSSSALRQVQNDAPTWQVYRDADAPAQSTSTSTLQPPASLSTSRQHNEEEVNDAFAIDEDLEDDENENDENSAPPASQSENPASSHARALSNASPDLAANTRNASSSGIHSHRRSSLSMSSLPRELAVRARDVTPPPSASRWVGATQDGVIENGEHDLPDRSVSGSATRARKRLRTSGEMSH